MRPKIISLFSGAGGLDLGFKQAGFEIVAAVDLSESAINSHALNFPGTKALAEDLVTLGPSGIVDFVDSELELGERIGIIGGPPCQAFSRANPKSAVEDPRNKLPMLYLEIVSALKAKYTVEFVLFENVSGIRDFKHKVTFDGILQKLEDLGFYSNVKEYCAADFDVPQKRNRVIISAFAHEVASRAFEPTPSSEPHRTVRDAIEGLPEPAYFSRTITPAEIPHHPNHWTMRPLSKRFTQPTEIRRSQSFRKLVWDKPSPTVAYGHREIHVHPTGHRRISIYEAMLLQGFPHDFIISGTLSAQVEQVSNAVPPPLAHALARAARDALLAEERVGA